MLALGGAAVAMAAAVVGMGVLRALGMEMLMGVGMLMVVDVSMGMLMGVGMSVVGVLMGMSMLVVTGVTADVIVMQMHGNFSFAFFFLLYLRDRGMSKHLFSPK